MWERAGPAEHRPNVTLPTVDDTTSEGSETVPLSIGTVSASGTISDNDGTPSLTINDRSVNEGAGSVTFTVTLSNPSSSPVSVSYASANGTATAGSDYSAVNGTLTFAPGETSKTLTVALLNDTVFEGSETFQINLSAPVNATLGDPQGLGTLKDDGTGDGGTDNDTPTIRTISSPTAAEGSPLVYSVTLSNASTTPTSFPYTLGGGSANSNDYTPPSFSDGVTLLNGVLTVPAGVSGFTVTLPTVDDTTSEGSETVPLSIGTVSAFQFR